MMLHAEAHGIEEKEEDEGNDLDSSSEWCNKDNLLRAHELFLAHLKQSSSPSEEFFTVSFVTEAVRPTLPLRGLRPILIRNLQVGCRHTSRVLYGWLCVEPLKIVAVQTVLVDEVGHAVNLSVYNALSHQHNAHKMGTLFHKGLKVAIKEPYLKVAMDGSLMIRVENPADFVRNPKMSEGSSSRNYISSPSSSLDQPRAVLDSRALRSQGNQAFVAQDWKKAIQLYTDALKILLQYKNASLLSPTSSSTLDVSKELMLGFSNRAEARLQLKHFEAAESDAKKALQLQRNHVKSISRRGRALHGLHQYKEAALCFKEALKLAAGDKNGANLKELRNALEASEICERQARTGKYDLLKMCREVKKGRVPVCAEYIGPVEIGPAREKSLGRGLLLTRDVEPGDLLLVSKSVAHAKVDHSSLIGSSLEEISSASAGSKSSPISNIYHEDLAIQVVERALTSRRFHEQVNTLSSTCASGIENNIPNMDLLAPEPISTGLDDVVYVEDEEGALNPGSIDIENVRNAIKNNAVVIPQESSATLWLLPSFINHSCAPNACWVRLGTECLLVRAVRHLAKGQEVTISYLDRAAVPLFARASFLQHFGEFECRCERCSFEMTLEPFTKWLRPKAVIEGLEIEGAVEVVQSLEWAFQNMKVFEDEKKQWLRTSYSASYVRCLDNALAQQSLENILPLETILRALHETLGGSEDMLTVVRQRVNLEECDPYLRGIIDSMCLCLFGSKHMP